jgi:hypothetical protein
MASKQSSWLESVRACLLSGETAEEVRPCRTLIAASDGGSRRGGDNDPWHRLAIYRCDGPKRQYLVSIQLYAHPSKEPFRATRRFNRAAQAAAFLITHDPLAPLKNENLSRRQHQQTQRAYEFHLADLLVALDKTARIERRSRAPRR